MRFKVLGRDFKTNDHPFWQTVEDGEWELAVLEKLAEIVKPTDVIFDVGAWIGVYTLLLSRLARWVVAFEPCPLSSAILIDNLNLNGIENVTVEPYALSDKNTVEKIYYYNPAQMDEMMASSMWNMVNRGQEQEGIYVPTKRIDSYCVRNHIKPDGIKIDVEGYEDKVLAGCTQDCWKIVELHSSFAGYPKVEGELIDGDWYAGHLFVEAV